MEKRVRVVRISHQKESPSHQKGSVLKWFRSRLKQFRSSYPLLYWLTATISVIAVLTIASALISLAASQISPNQPPNPPIPAPTIPFPTSQSSTSSPRATPSATPSSQKPAPAPPPPVNVNTGNTGNTGAGPSPTESPDFYASGDCLAGNFESSNPDDVEQVSCSSDRAYKILATYPDETDANVCQDVTGAELGYVEEYLIDGDVVNSQVDCLGPA